jgi:hypothetical protein
MFLNDQPKANLPKVKYTKVDPARMRPAGIKSKNEVEFRQDSVQYLDRQRTKTVDDRTKLYGDMGQSGKLGATKESYESENRWWSKRDKSFDLDKK